MMMVKLTTIVCVFYQVCVAVFISFDPITYTVNEGSDTVAILRMIRTGDTDRETVVTVTPQPGSALCTR